MGCRLGNSAATHLRENVDRTLMVWHGRAMPEQPEPRARKKYIFDPADVEVLADRFRQAGGKRILMSKESAALIAHALQTYTHMIRPSVECEMPFSVEQWKIDGSGIEEVLARSTNGIIARGAYERACAERPNGYIKLRNGARPMAERPPPQTSPADQGKV